MRARANRAQRYLLERHIEQINPTSMIFLWQKHAARKSTLSSVGTAIRRREPEGGRKQVCKVVREGPSECNGNNLRIGTAREPDEFEWRDTSRRLDAQPVVEIQC